MGRLSRNRRDAFFHLARAEGYRARSAFKLQEADEVFELFGQVRCVIDLCAAPGSWSQYVVGRVAPSDQRRVIAIDLQPIAPIEGVEILQGDITAESTRSAVADRLRPHAAADAIICDGAPDVTGLHQVDECMQRQLLHAGLDFARALLKPGGLFLAKIFRGEHAWLLHQQLSQEFERVDFFKPASSRNSSAEALAICRSFGAPALPRAVALFVGCGDLRGYDSERNSFVPSDEQNGDAIQPPIDPPYKEAIELRKCSIKQRQSQPPDSFESPPWF